MSFCAIILDSGDRPEFLEHCKAQMEDQTIKPAELIEGMGKAAESGHDFFYIIEGDGYYPDNYFEVMEKHRADADLIGVKETILYYLKNRRFIMLPTDRISNLFCVGFSKKLIETAKSGRRLWKEKANKKLLALADFEGTFPIVIKQGHGNTLRLTTDDPKFSFLSRQTRPESFRFYVAMWKKMVLF